MLQKFAQLKIPNDLKNPAGQNQLDTGVNIFIGIVAAIAVLFIVFAGIKYITSKGDPAATAKATKTIIYAAVGLAVCMLSFVIVQFVLGTV